MPMLLGQPMRVATHHQHSDEVLKLSESDSGLKGVHTEIGFERFGTVLAHTDATISYVRGGAFPSPPSDPGQRRHAYMMCIGEGACACNAYGQGGICM